MFEEPTKPISTDTIVSIDRFTTSGRIKNNQPIGYRLATLDGKLVLQGRYSWQEGRNNYGYDWETIPTVDLTSEEPNVPSV